MKYGITFGAFDLLHAGHVLFLEHCREFCDYLSVGLHLDPSLERPEKNKPIESAIERIIKLKGCRYVDNVIVYEREKDIEFILKNNKPSLHYYFVGQDHEKDKVTGDDIINVTFIPRNHDFSSSGLRQRVINAYYHKQKVGASTPPVDITNFQSWAQSTESKNLINPNGRNTPYRRHTHGL